MIKNLNFPSKKYIFIYSLIGSLLTTIVPIMVAIDHLFRGNFLLRLIDISTLFVLVCCVFYISFWLNLKWCRIPKIKLLFLNIIVFLLISAVSILIHYPIWKQIVHIPLAFYLRDEFVRNLTIFIVSYLATRFYLENLEKQQIKTELTELQNENLTNQVKGLMQQINPHFFFNTLNTLSGLVQENSEKSELFIEKLSNIFRYVLKMQENSIVLLSEELKFAEDYFYLLKIRFEDKLFLDFQIQNLDNEKIAPLCSQLLIENVIKHNKMNRHFPVNIRINIENDYLKICNNMNPQIIENSLGLGLANLNKRCELLTGKSIIIEKVDNLFCVKVPIIKS